MNVLEILGMLAAIAAVATVQRWLMLWRDNADSGVQVTHLFGSVAFIFLPLWFSQSPQSIFGNYQTAVWIGVLAIGTLIGFGLSEIPKKKAP